MTDIGTSVNVVTTCTCKYDDALLSVDSATLFASLGMKPAARSLSISVQYCLQLSMGSGEGLGCG